MPWCPVCDKLQEIYPDTRGDYVAVPTASERYNRYGEYIGYEEGESLTTRIRTIPRCKICNAVFQFPNATSKEQYFYARKQVVVDRWHAKKPHATVDDDDSRFPWFSALLGPGVAFTLGLFVTASITDNGGVALLVAFLCGIGAYVLWDRIAGKNRKEKGKEKTITPEIQAWQNRLDELQSMSYSEQNYQALKNM